jgi:hypothetical protein
LAAPLRRSGTAGRAAATAATIMTGMIITITLMIIVGGVLWPVSCCLEGLILLLEQRVCNHHVGQLTSPVMGQQRGTSGSSSVEITTMNAMICWN